MDKRTGHILFDFTSPDPLLPGVYWSPQSPGTFDFPTLATASDKEWERLRAWAQHHTASRVIAESKPLPREQRQCAVCDKAFETHTTDVCKLCPDHRVGLFKIPHAAKLTLSPPADVSPTSITEDVFRKPAVPPVKRKIPPPSPAKPGLQLVPRTIALFA